MRVQLPLSIERPPTILNGQQSLFHILTNFIFWIDEKSPKILGARWGDVFSKEVALPLPEEHPLYNYLKGAVDAKMGLLS